MDDTKIINLKKYRKVKKTDIVEFDEETIKVWNFTNELETILIKGLETIPSIQITGVLANRLGEMLRCTRVETGVDITNQIIDLVKKYSK